MEGCAVKVVHRNDAPRKLPRRLRRVIEKLRDACADIEAEPIPSRSRMISVKESSSDRGPECDSFAGVEDPLFASAPR